MAPCVRNTSHALTLCGIIMPPQNKYQVRTSKAVLYPPPTYILNVLWLLHLHGDAQLATPPVKANAQLLSINNHVNYPRKYWLWILITFSVQIKFSNHSKVPISQLVVTVYKCKPKYTRMYTLIVWIMKILWTLLLLVACYSTEVCCAQKCSRRVPTGTPDCSTVETPNCFINRTGSLEPLPIPSPK